MLEDYQDVAIDVVLGVRELVHKPFLFLLLLVYVVFVVVQFSVVQPLVLENFEIRNRFLPWNLQSYALQRLH